MGIWVWLGVGASAWDLHVDYGRRRWMPNARDYDNFHVPAGLLVNLAIWQQQPHWPTLFGRCGDYVLTVGSPALVVPRREQMADDRNACCLAER